MLDWTRRCAAVIPCLNEAGRVGPVVARVREHLPTVFVVDDGSHDATGLEAAAAGATVIRRSTTGGKGVALRAGWAEAARRGFSWVLILDGDGQHAPADIPLFFEAAARSPARLIIGNRMTCGAPMPLVRRAVNRLMSRWLSNLTGFPLPDSQCGFRLIHLPTLSQLQLTAKGFVIESEMVVKFLQAGEQVEFIPIQVIYGREESKISAVRDTVRWMRWWAGQTPASP